MAADPAVALDAIGSAGFEDRRRSLPGHRRQQRALQVASTTTTCPSTSGSSSTPSDRRPSHHLSVDAAPAGTAVTQSPGEAFARAYATDRRPARRSPSTSPSPKRFEPTKDRPRRHRAEPAQEPPRRATSPVLDGVPPAGDEERKAVTDSDAAPRGGVPVRHGRGRGAPDPGLGADPRGLGRRPGGAGHLPRLPTAGTAGHRGEPGADHRRARPARPPGDRPAALRRATTSPASWPACDEIEQTGATRARDDHQPERLLLPARRPERPAGRTWPATARRSAGPGWSSPGCALVGDFAVARPAARRRSLA